MTKEQQQMTKGDIFKGNIYGMESCTHMIAVVEQKDSGTLFEIGYFYAKGKKIVDILHAKRPPNKKLWSVFFDSDIKTQMAITIKKIK